MEHKPVYQFGRYQPFISDKMQKNPRVSKWIHSIFGYTAMGAYGRQLIFRRLLEYVPMEKVHTMLDLGCGTGLLGACLGRIQGAMVGVELSPRMIEQAARHNVYDKFHNVDLHDALEATPPALYDVIAALDVFIYAGDMTAAIPQAFAILRSGGYFFFSCERTDESGDDLVLRASQRYAHKASHIESLCREAGFGELQIDPVVLRYENNQPVEGFLAMAKKTV
ncbi:MAG: methyltransferase domain-containing protein [Cytophagaceae bacterium]|nr:MAG: methyltransferase domain-containing protein [Cytophagaceae bacterium]